MASNKELLEKDFIHESPSKNPFPLWLWFFIAIALGIVLWGGGSWFNKTMSKEYADNLFLQVTNRDFSNFLWQFPEYMRINAKRKNGYLTGFQYENKVNILAGEAENWVVAPPEILFLYHSWQRQISREYAMRAIPLNEFKEFLNNVEEWQPSNWPKAPKNYTQLISTIDQATTPQDLSSLALTDLPAQVRQAFQGWKNYFKEGEAINAIRPTFAELQEFLKVFPHYARPFWRNIVNTSARNYLYSLESGKFNPEDPALENELAPFLKVAFYNYKKSLQEKGILGTSTKPAS